MNPPNVPTGNTTAVMQQYYHYLYSYFLSGIKQNFYIHWDVLLWVLLWLFVLAGGFYVFTRYQRTTRADKEPYPVESYNGYIQEGNGPMGTFLTLFYIGMFLWLVAKTVTNLLFGQIY